METLLQNLGTFISSLFTIANEQARRIRNALLITIVSIVTVYLTQLIFNCTGVTNVVAIVCDIIVLWKWLSVKRFLAFAVAGEVAEALGAKQPPESTAVIGEAEVPKLNLLFDMSLDVTLYAIFWMHVFCFFVPMMSLRENPWIGFSFLIGGTAYVIMYPKGKLFRKSLVWGIVAGLLIMFLQTISFAGWVKLGWTGPYDGLRMTATDRALAEALEADKKANDRKNAARLGDIQKLREEGKEISKEDEKFLEQLKNGGLLQKIGKSFSSSAEAKTKPVEAPKPELKKQAIRYPLDYFAGEKVLRQGNVVEVHDGGGYAVFQYSDLPQRPDITYYVVFSIIRKTNGKHLLEVNSGQGGTRFLDHYASERVETCVFKFDPSIQSQFFHPGDNRFKISSPGSDIEIQDAFVQVEYLG